MIVESLQKELNLKKWQVEMVIKLIDDGNTNNITAFRMTADNRRRFLNLFGGSQRTPAELYHNLFHKQILRRH